MFDEMSLKKYIGWNGSKFTGYVDIGDDTKADKSSALGNQYLCLCF